MLRGSPPRKMAFRRSVETYHGIFAEELLFPCSLELRSKRGIPHPHCELGDSPVWA
jgi:hypothetical protein